MRRLPDYSGSLPTTALEPLECTTLRTTTVSRDYTDKALGETEGPAIGHKCRKKRRSAASIGKLPSAAGSNASSPLAFGGELTAGAFPYSFACLGGSRQAHIIDA